MLPSTFLLILACCVGFSFCDRIFGEWEDPNDIFGRSKSSCGTEFDACKEELSHCRDELYALRSENRCKGEQFCKGPRVIKQPSVGDHYLKRFINVLLTSANFKHRQLGEGNEMRVNLNLYFNSKTLSILQAFASDDPNGHSWAELDASFITVFDGDPTFRASYASDFSTSDGLQSDSPGNRVDDYHLTILIAVVSSIAFCMIWVYLTGRSLKSAFFVGVVLIVSFCFGWTWWSEVENQRMKFMVELSRTEGDQIPDSCKNPSSGWFGWLRKSSREEDCLKYLKARNVHPIAAVDLAHVFSKTLQTLVFSWLPALAKSASDAIDLFYGTSMFGSFIGFTARITTGPILAIMIIMALAVIMITKSSFRFKTFFWEIDYGSHMKSLPSLPQAQEGTDEYEEITKGQELQDLGGSSSQSSEAKKVKRVASKLRRPKVRRSQTVSLPIALDLPLLLRSPTQKVSEAPVMSKQRSEEKRFRQLRRAYSGIERPLLNVDQT